MCFFYVTTPIYYPNAKPHIGSLYSTFLADSLARWNKILGKEVFFLTGLDEHGEKIAQAAKSNGLDPQSFVDGMATPFIKAWADFGFEYDMFFRTSSKAHKESVHRLFEILLKNGDIYKSEYIGYYCVPCETFAKKSEIHNVDEVLCPTCARPTQQIAEENYFFKLSKYQDKLLKFYEDNPHFITPPSRFNEVISFVKSGLEDLSMSRKNVSWGIPFPGDASHTVYVWGDALTNYISALGFGDGSFSSRSEDFWKNSHHVIGKDIVRFHAIYWPALLMAVGLTPPKRLFVHGYILVNNQKMSKSLFNVVDPLEIKERYGISALKYYLAKQLSTAQDCDFSLEELKNTFNADLANNFGNLLNRSLTLCLKNDLSFIEKNRPINNQAAKEVLALIGPMLELFKSSMSNFAPNQALAALMDFCSHINAMLHKTEPWKLIKTDRQSFEDIMVVAIQGIFVASTCLYPFISEKIDIIWRCLGLDYFSAELTLDDLKTIQSFKLNPMEGVVFARIEESVPLISNQQSTSQAEQECSSACPEVEEIKFEDFIKVKVVVGKIIAAEKIEKSDKLLKLQVDFGPFGHRQIVSGIAKFYDPLYLVGKKAAFVLNLEKKKIFGVESHGMILAAKNDSDLSFISPEKDFVEPGTILS